MKATAVPMKTMLIVTMIGATLFFEKVLNKTQTGDS